ncbi:MAG: cholesterol oxidase substrate-binding domain-containing protein [Nitriliruptorales bacterium]|nr:cholesterol oxidase substrate-binding domain-containing protein [Nitriliruptorales bacterium]
MTRGQAPSPSRRAVLRHAAILGAAAWAPAFRFGTEAENSCPDLPGFPSEIERWRQAYANWSGQIVVDDVWTCAPRTSQDILDLADWAAASGHRLRPQGASHGWSPLIMSGSESCREPVVLVSTRDHLTGMSWVAGSPGQVRVEPGASLEQLLGFLGAAGFGFANTPAIGEITVGGMLAIGAHGTSVPTAGDGDPIVSHGSICDRVVSITVVGWARTIGRHRLVTIPRHSPAAHATIASLGRCFVTEVVLQGEPDNRLRCVSRLDIEAAELFAPPEKGGRSLSSFLDQSGRVEAIWFPFTERPWVKIWEIAPTRPLTSRPTNGPYNYPFADNIPKELSDLATLAVTGHPEVAPVMGQMMLAATVAGLTTSASWDLWGPSRDLLLYTKASTMRARALGHVVLARRADVQRVLHGLWQEYEKVIEEHQARDEFPINMPVEVRVTGLDAGNAITSAATVPALSPLAPVKGRPELDTAVYFNSLSLTGTPGLDAAWAQLERALVRRFGGSGTVIRPEWSKGWAHGDSGAWTDEGALRGWIPDGFGRGAWARAVQSLDRLDPHGVFSNPFLDGLLAA